MKKEPNIKIFVSHHKPGYIYEDDVYVPIQVGKKNAKIDLGIIGDDTGDNISEKNSNYAELTAQYWVWKNYDLSDVDYVGFCHYRRYMTYGFKYNILRFWNNMDKNQSIYRNLTTIFLYIFGVEINIGFDKNLIKTFSNSTQNFVKSNYKDIYLAKKQYWLQRKPLYHMGIYNDKLRNILYNIIIKKDHNYKKTIDYVEKLNGWNGCNIWIMKKELFIEYCEWFFDILFSYEKELSHKNLLELGVEDGITAGTRFLGCLGERLFNLRLYHKCNLDISRDANLIFFKI